MPFLPRWPQFPWKRVTHRCVHGEWLGANKSQIQILASVCYCWLAPAGHLARESNAGGHLKKIQFRPKFCTRWLYYQRNEDRMTPHCAALHCVILMVFTVCPRLKMVFAEIKINDMGCHNKYICSERILPRLMLAPLCYECCYRTGKSLDFYVRFMCALVGILRQILMKMSLRLHPMNEHSRNVLKVPFSPNWNTTNIV